MRRRETRNNVVLTKAIKKKRREIVNNIALDLHKKRALEGIDSNYGLTKKIYNENIGMHPWTKNRKDNQLMNDDSEYNSFYHNSFTIVRIISMVEK